MGKHRRASVIIAVLAAALAVFALLRFLDRGAPVLLSPENTAERVGADGSLLTICQGCQREFEDLKIAVAYARDGEYIESGLRKRGAVAALKVFVRDDSDSNRIIIARVGTVHRVLQYLLAVEGIEPGSFVNSLLGGSSGSVSVRIVNRPNY